MAAMPSMGKRASSMPTIAGESSTADPNGNSPELQNLLRRLPAQYALATSFADRLQHTRLMAALMANAEASSAVHLAWAAEEGLGRAAIWLVFADRRGSLGLITALLSELGVNIGKASVFSTTDGVAVDSFTVDRCAASPTRTPRSVRRRKQRRHQTPGTTRAWAPGRHQPRAGTPFTTAHSLYAALAPANVRAHALHAPSSS